MVELVGGVSVIKGATLSRSWWSSIGKGLSSTGLPRLVLNNYLR